MPEEYDPLSEALKASRFEDTPSIAPFSPSRQERKTEEEQQKALTPYSGPLAETLNAIGNPAWKDEKIPVEQRVGSFLQSHGNTLKPWEEVEPEFRKTFPQLDPSRSQETYGQALGIQQAREKFAGSEETFGSKVQRLSLPGYSAGRAVALHNTYMNSLERLRKGEATPDDFDVVAAHERSQELAQTRGFGGQVAEGLMRIPAILGEAALMGGAMKVLGGTRIAGLLRTPAASAGAAGAAIVPAAAKLGILTVGMPSMYADRAVQNAMKNGGSVSDFQNLAPAYTMGALQVAVLGTVMKGAQSVEGPWLATLPQRAYASAKYGVPGQLAVDVLGSAAGLETGYGVLGDIYRGDFDKALEHATVQAITFAAFGLVHGGSGKMDFYTDALQALKKKGYTPRQANEVLSGQMKFLNETMAKNPDLTREGAKALFDKQPEGPVRDFGLNLAGQFPEVSPSSRGVGAKGTPIPEKPSAELIGAREDAARRTTETKQEWVDKDGKVHVSMRSETVPRSKIGGPEVAEPKPTEAPRTVVIDPTTGKPVVEPTGRPGVPTSDLDPVTRSLGMGPAVKEVPVKPPDVFDSMSFQELAFLAKQFKVKIGGRVGAEGVREALRQSKEGKAMADLAAKQVDTAKTAPKPPSTLEPPKAEIAPPAKPGEDPTWQTEYARLRSEGKTHDQASSLANLHADEGQVWQHTGTKFVEGVEHDTTQIEGQEYRVKPKIYPPGHELARPGAVKDSVRVGLEDASGKEVARVTFDPLPNGTYEADVVKSEVKGAGRVLYDYATQGGLKIAPSKVQSADGKAFWQRNAERAAGVEKAPVVPKIGAPEAKPEGTPRAVVIDPFAGKPAEPTSPVPETKPAEQHALEAVQETAGKHNLASIVDVREALAKRGITDRAEQDAAINAARKSGKLSPSVIESDRGRTPEQHQRLRDAAIRENGQQLGYLSVLPEEAPAKPTVKPAFERLRDRWQAGEQLTLDTVADEFGLDARERHVLRERIPKADGVVRSFADIAKDPEMKGVSRQRIKQIEQDAMRKMGTEGRSVFDVVHKEMQADRIADLEERGETTTEREMRNVDPAAGQRVGKKRLSTIAARDAELDALTDKILKGEINGPEAEAEFARINRKTQKPPEKEKATTSVVPRPAAEPEAGQPAPVRHPGGPGLPEGAVEPGVEPAPEGAEPPAAARPGVEAPPAESGETADHQLKAVADDIRKTENAGAEEYNTQLRMARDLVPEGHRRMLGMERYEEWSDIPKMDEIAAEAARIRPEWKDPDVLFKALKDGMRPKMSVAESLKRADERMTERPVTPDPDDDIFAQEGFGRPLSGAEKGKGGVGGGQEGAEGKGAALRTTALKNAQMDAERVKRGEPAILSEARKADPAVWDEAMKRIDADPKLPFRLVEELAKKPRIPTDDEQAILLHHKIALENEHLRTMLEYNEASKPHIRKTVDALTFDGMLAKEEALRNQMNQMDEVTKKTGTLAGRSFRWRRLFADEEFSLQKMEAELEFAKKRQLTPEEKAKLVDDFKKIQATTAEAGKAEEGFRGAKLPAEEIPTSKEYEEMSKTRTEAKDARADFRRQVNKALEKNEGWGQYLSDLLVKLRINMVISSPVTMAKLVAASIQRIAIAPIEEAAGALLSRMPFLSQIAGKAPREGRGFVPSVEAAAGKAEFTQGFKDAWRITRTGRSEIDVRHGETDTARGYLDLQFSLHDAMKAPAVRGEYTRSFLNRLDKAARTGEDVTSPDVILRLESEAYQDGLRAKFRQENWLVEAINSGIENMRRPQANVASKITGLGLKMLLPVVRIPTNIAFEIGTYVFGTGTGSIQAIRAFARGIETLKAPEADSIMRQFKKGSLGAGLLLLGFFNPDVFGGFYSGKRDEKDVKPGAARIPGFELPGWMGGPDVPHALQHNPALETLQFGAAVRRARDTMVKGEKEGIGAGTAEAVLGLAEEIPYVRETREVAKGLSTSAHERGAFFGNLTKSLAIPQLVQWLAGKTDQDTSGQPVPRKPEGVWEHLKTGIPWLRREVPGEGERKALQKEDRKIHPPQRQKISR